VFIISEISGLFSEPERAVKLRIGNRKIISLYHYVKILFIYLCRLVGTILGMTLCAGKESEIQLTTAGSLGL
jgi:hypothetical protein